MRFRLTNYLKSVGDPQSADPQKMRIADSIRKSASVCGLTLKKSAFKLHVHVKAYISHIRNHNAILRLTSVHKVTGLSILYITYALIIYYYLTFLSEITKNITDISFLLSQHSNKKRFN